jgi:indolepyruvate ferredoxin oxidoreductase
VPPISDKSFNVYVAGIGGAGVLTIGSILGLAAYLEGKASSVLQFTGLAQKNGTVVSQIKLAQKTADIAASRIGSGDADLLLATDLVAGAQSDSLRRLSPTRTAAVINIDSVPTADVIRHRDMSLPTAQMVASIRNKSQHGCSHTLHAAKAADGLFGDTIAANVLMLGYAWQNGLLPLSEPSLTRAIELNGTAVELNKRAFVWGRFLAIREADVKRIAGLEATRSVEPSLDELIKTFAENLRAYQNDRYAAQYLKLVQQARTAGRAVGDDLERFAAAVAQNAHRVMAYKDEYEVARLYVRPEFKAALHAQFSSVRRASVWLAPPLLSRREPSTGRPHKRRFGPWIFNFFALLSRLKFLRGTPFDPFGWTAERRMQRDLVTRYLTLTAELSSRLTPARLEASIALAEAPADIRGFGPVKSLACEKVYAQMARQIAALERDGASLDTAA